MKYTIVVLWVVFVGIGSCLIADRAIAQHDGFLGASDVAPPASDSMLPPGAVHQGAYVQHTVQSQQENLHLLASFYYGNSREWRKIYNDNRAAIKNPNRLSVGEVLQIHVGENWQPMVAYDKWFALAVRNGEWQPGVPWQRANEVPVPQGSPSTPSVSAPGTSMEIPAVVTESATPTPAIAQTPAPQSSAPIPEEAPPSEHPAAEELTPVPEQPDSAQPEQTSPAEETPAEPAF